MRPKDLRCWQVLTGHSKLDKEEGKFRRKMERLVRKRKGMSETFRSVDTVEKEVKKPHTFF